MAEKAYITTVQTENTQVARIVAAHNAAIAAIQGVSARDTQESMSNEYADRYSELFSRILKAIGG